MIPSIVVGAAGLDLFGLSVSVCLSVSVSLCLCLCLSLPAYLSVCLSVSLSLSLSPSPLVLAIICLAIPAIPLLTRGWSAPLLSQWGLSAMFPFSVIIGEGRLLCSISTLWRGIRHVPFLCNYWRRATASPCFHDVLVCEVLMLGLFPSISARDGDGKLVGCPSPVLRTNSIGVLQILSWLFCVHPRRF